MPMPIDRNLGRGDYRPPVSTADRPRMARRAMSMLVFGLIILVGAEYGFAQDKKIGQAPPAAAPPAELVPPSAEGVVTMIRSTLLSLEHALVTGNFTVMRDLATPSFSEANNAARLHQIFSHLSAQGVSLSAVGVLVPKLEGAPAIDEGRRLHIRGLFPGDPVEIRFHLQYEAIGGRWRLFGIGVNPTKSARTNTVTNAGSAGKEKLRPQVKQSK